MNKQAELKTKSKADAPADDVSQHLGRRVRQLRTERGWSLERLAGLSGVSRSMLSQIERERANPTLAVTVRISNGFGTVIRRVITDARIRTGTYRDSRR